MGKCPPGIICIEHFTFLFLLLISIIIIYYFTYVNNKNLVINSTANYNSSDKGIFPSPSYSFSNIENDILLNPYSAPLMNQNFLPSPNKGIPINIPTQSVDTSYRQVGILSRSNSENILPLMGKPLFTNRDKWNYYSMSDKNNMIKIPINFKGKSATNEYGVDRLYNGDQVYVEGYNDAFKVTIYDNQQMQYIPYL